MAKWMTLASMLSHDDGDGDETSIGAVISGMQK